MTHNSYQDGYRDGMEHLSEQVKMIEDENKILSSLLSKAVLLRTCATEAPKPGVDLWLVLDSGSITTGFFLNKEYLADSGLVVKPVYWCIVPPLLKGKKIERLTISNGPKGI